MLNSCFSLKDLGPLHYFLGIQVLRTKEGRLHLSQTQCIKALLHKANMQNSTPQPTPLVSTLYLCQDGFVVVKDPTKYRSVVGALQYILITITLLSC